MDPAREKSRGVSKHRSFTRRYVTLAVVVVVILAGYGLYKAGTGTGASKNSLVIYTYNSFLKCGPNYTAAYDAVFGTFAREHNINITVETPKIGLLQQLESNNNKSQPDIVIGLTNINSVQAVNAGLLLNYSPPGDSYINASLMREMGYASNYVTPYEYSYLGIDYLKSFVNNSSFSPTLSNLLNPVFAKNLLLENPAQDSTGEAFLLWQIAYYTYILHENWTSWWQSIKQYASGHIYSSWSDAFSAFEATANSNLLVSYLTDPAYNSYMGYGNNSSSTVSFFNGTPYGWRTIYGIGIVNNTPNTALDKEFVNYFLSPTVQNELPLNEWMYPANSTISLPPVYQDLVNQDSIVPLNNYITAEDITANISTWELEWATIMQ